MTATMLMTAWALERFGYRRTFVCAMGVFIVGSLLGFASGSGAKVILARVLQGSASGIVQPLAMVVMSQIFPPSQRGRAMGIYGVEIVLVPALGPTVGGLLVDQYDWRDVFLVVVPFCLAGMAVALFIMPTRDEDSKAVPRRFDVTGFLLLVCALTTWLTGLSNGQREGWNAFFILALFTLALLSVAGFILWELVTPHPLLSLQVFSNLGFSAGCVVAFALGAGIYGSTYIIPLFVQTVQGFTPTRSGLLLMPAGLVLGLVFPIAGQLSDKLPPHIHVMSGLVLFGLSCWLSGGADVDTPFWTMAWWVMLGRIGLGVMLPALNAGALRALPPEKLAQGSGSLNFVRQLGGVWRQRVVGGGRQAHHVPRRCADHRQCRRHGSHQPAGAADVPLGQSVRLPAAGRYSYRRAGLAGSMLVPKAQMMAYQDGFYLVALFFFAALAPAWLMRIKRPRPAMERKTNPLPPAQ
ncbi:DHA2 family efflux MFS transporter permease subunit [Candidatus Sodalis pierantonius]|uniref:DHA2 family efflux MFS transporter permease subunit n=1 Tax=Candidatus Sodalis pierantonii TaxID=1486991 RepID=UPI0004B1BA51|nr:DHA2 family efflux MFS transporter permease subunit [Candidatus Sodalis pierantonius]